MTVLHGTVLALVETPNEPAVRARWGRRLSEPYNSLSKMLSTAKGLLHSHDSLSKHVKKCKLVHTAACNQI